MEGELHGRRPPASATILLLDEFYTYLVASLCSVLDVVLIRGPISTHRMTVDNGDPAAGILSIGDILLALYSALSVEVSPMSPFTIGSLVTWLFVLVSLGFPAILCYRYLPYISVLEIIKVLALMLPFPVVLHLCGKSSFMRFLGFPATYLEEVWLFASLGKALGGDVVVLFSNL
jgi:hypothetical protein